MRNTFIFAIVSLFSLGFIFHHLTQNYLQIHHRFPFKTSFFPSSPPTPPPPPTPIELMAWLAWWDHDQTLESLQANAAFLTTISPSWYHLNDHGQLQPLSAANSAPVYYQASLSGLLVMPTVGNDLSQDKVTTFLSNQANFDPAIDYLIKEAQEYGYAGFDLDFEMIPSEYASTYTQFLTQLSAKLHQADLKLSVAVHAQTGSLTDWELALSHDYASIGQFADQIRLMAYDFHYSDSAPGPITPLDELAKVIAFARQTIPLEKIVLGLPLYGYNWPPEGSGTSVTHPQALELLTQNQGTYERDPQSHALVGRYGPDDAPHIVWFEDAQSTLYKINLARAQGINRFIFWRLGSQDPSTFPLIDSSVDLIYPGK